MGCKITDIPNYDNKLLTPRMQFAISNGEVEYEAKISKVVDEMFPKTSTGAFEPDTPLSREEYTDASGNKTSEYQEFQDSQSDKELDVIYQMYDEIVNKFAGAEQNARVMGVKEEDMYPPMKRRKAKPNEEQTITLFRGEGKSRMATDPAMQFAEEGSANLEFWAVDSSFAESYGDVRKKSFTFTENDMFDISPVGDKIEQGWMDLLKVEKHTKFSNNNDRRKFLHSYLKGLDESRNTGRLNNAYRGVNLFYKDGGGRAVEYLSNIGYKGVTMTNAKGTKTYAFFSDISKAPKMTKKQLLSERVLVQENSGPLAGYDEVGALFVRNHTGGRRYAPTKKVVLYHGTPASELEGGSFNLDAEYNQSGGDWMQGVHATPDINIAKDYYKNGGSVYAVGYNIGKVWHLRGNKISNKLLKDYERALRDTGMGEGLIKHNLSGFAYNGQLKGLDPSEQREFLLKHGYNLVLDGSQRVIMLDPSESGTSPLRLNDKEINNALGRRKTANKSMQTYNNLVSNKKKSDRKREEIDKEWKDGRSDRYYQQLIKSLDK